MVTDSSAVTRLANVFSDALGVSVGQEIYVVYRASSRNAPHAKAVRVVQCQATLAEGTGEITLLCEDGSGARYVYRYDQVILDLNQALRHVARERLREDMGLDELCRVAVPGFKYKRKADGDAASSAPFFDPTRKVDEADREALLQRVNERVRSLSYWKGGPRK